MAGALGLVITTDVATEGKHAIPVYVDDSLPIVGPSRACVVTTGEIPFAGGPPIAVRLAPAGTPAVGPAIPVYVVPGGGSLTSNPALAYTNKVKALSPIGYWPLAESSGATAIDESGNGRDGTYVNATLGVTGIGDGRTAASFAATGRVGLPAGFQAAFNRSEGTAALWVQISALVWADGAVRAAVRVNTDGSNRVYLLKNNVANQLALRYDAGGVSKVVAINGVVATTWIHIALTWSKSADQVIGYLNGVQQGATLTGLGVWAGAVSDAEIAASDNGPNNPFSGQVAHVAVFGSALSAAQIATLAAVP